MSAPIILVPGAWLGGWAWEEVAADLRERGHEVVALTLPGLESTASERSDVSLEDHIEAIVEAVSAAPEPPVLAVHSIAGVAGYAASDRIPDRIAAIVYVDTAPGTGPVNPDFEGDEWPLPGWEDLGENLDGLSEETLQSFRTRAVPEPAAILREGVKVGNPARTEIPSTVICTGAPAEQLKEWAKEGYGWLNGLGDLRHVEYVDLPTSHWPMWSRPRELADLIAAAAAQAARG